MSKIRMTINKLKKGQALSMMLVGILLLMCSAIITYSVREAPKKETDGRESSTLAVDETTTLVEDSAGATVAETTKINSEKPVSTTAENEIAGTTTGRVEDVSHDTAAASAAKKPASQPPAKTEPTHQETAIPTTIYVPPVETVVQTTSVPETMQSPVAQVTSAAGYVMPAGGWMITDFYANRCTYEEYEANKSGALLPGGMVTVTNPEGPIVYF